MTRLVWDQQDYESGLDQGVFYTQDGSGESWNGLISITENPSDSEETVVYLDGVRTRRTRKTGYFSGTINAVSYPKSFYSDIIVQRRKNVFGLSYRIKTKMSYKIHLVYNVLLAPSAITHQQGGVDLLSWDFESLPLPVPGAKRSAHLIVDPSIAYPWTMTAFEDILYGTDSVSARLPLPEEVFDIFEVNSILRVTDNGDGSFTVDGPDSAIVMLDSTTFQITWPSAVFIDSDSYTIHSL